MELECFLYKYNRGQKSLETVSRPQESGVRRQGIAVGQRGEVREVADGGKAWTFSRWMKL